MSNGDIKLSDITQEEFLSKPHDVQHWLQFKALQHFAEQPAVCKKRFVQVRHVKIAIAVLGAFGVGAGLIKWEHLKPIILGMF